MQIPESQHAEQQEALRNLFRFVYPAEDYALFHSKLMELLARHRKKIDAHRHKDTVKSTNNDGRVAFDHEDVMLITYPDVVRCDDGTTPLAALHHFLSAELSDTFSVVHLLPFYPYSSDDGFSIIDYRQVNQEVGSWKDIRSMAAVHRLMFDAVINHISAQSRWFSDYCKQKEPYRDYFIEKDPTSDYSQVIRPRTSSLFSVVETVAGVKEVWTTFSADQVDLNYRNPRLLLEILDILLGYISDGAAVLRLDAINYLWKESGTKCSNLPECHAVIQMMRTVFDMIAPWVVLVSETNIPHVDNVTYFGDGHNEAQVIYQFSLPPLVVHSFLSHEMETLTRWIRSLEYGDSTSYLNFLSSHDGVGIVPASGILSDAEVAALVNLSSARGGMVSAKTNPDGTEVPYELNCTFYDLLCDPKDSEVSNIDKFLSAHAILLALKGIPAIYFNSLFGEQNNVSGVQETGIARTINRKKYTRAELTARVNDEPRSKTIFNQLKALINVRKTLPAFSPHADQQVLNLHSSLLVIVRGGVSCSPVLTIVNSSNRPVMILCPPEFAPTHQPLELLAGTATSTVIDGETQLHIPAYGFGWWGVKP
ncbi:MAG TPA: alpha-amylase family glycosyl hydrolase [Sphaerochaeta sp.]|nr:alpha-amylase family glycosyl hydrolase [Sphaerochaeta sp.]HQB90096.1 alpha-amylase family glycosyl hydrolase [Sphaerochaeta sp.]